MKKITVLILLVYINLDVYSQQSQERQVGSFSGVKVAEGIDVYLKKDDKEMVRVEVTGGDPEDVITEVSGSYLKVHMRSGNFTRNIQAKVYVSYVRVDKLSASSAGNIFSEGVLKASDLELQASSAGNIELSIESESVEVSASSASEIELQGSTKSMTGDASSAAQIDAYDLNAREVEIEVSSGASAKVSVEEELSAHASSGGSIRYRGNPSKSNTNSSSGGSVKKSN